MTFVSRSKDEEKKGETKKDEKKKDEKKKGGAKKDEEKCNIGFKGYTLTLSECNLSVS
jgi:hypothetical protein